MFEQFPYTDMHQLNLDWIVKIAKDFLDQYTHIQQLISDGEQSLQELTTEGLNQLQNSTTDGINQLQEKAENLENALQQWYNTHSLEMAQQLAAALQDMANALSAALSNIDNHVSEVIASIPADYSAISAIVQALTNKTALTDYSIVTGSYVNYTSGAFSGASWATRTQYINIKGYTEITLVAEGYGDNRGMAFYDNSFTFISGTQYPSGTNTINISVPSNASYAAFTLPVVSIMLTNDFSNFNYFKNKIVNDSIIRELTPTFTDNSYINSGNGNFSSLNGAKRTGYINRDFYDYIYLLVAGYNDARGIAFYDADQNFIIGYSYGGWGIKLLYFAIPDKAKYFAFTGAMDVDNEKYYLAKTDNALRKANIAYQNTVIIPEMHYTENNYINYTTGSRSYLSGSLASTFIDISNAEQIIVVENGLGDNRGLALYDENGIFVRGTQYASGYHAYIINPDNQYKYIAVTKQSNAFELYIIPKKINKVNAGNPLSMFHSIAGCGDSYTSCVLYTEGGVSRGENEYASWVSNIGRVEGIDSYIYAHGGATTETYLSTSDCLPKLLTDPARDLYILNLGINDSGYSVPLGTIADIHEDYTTNPNTFFGNYGRIIDQIRAHAPNAKLIISKILYTVSDVQEPTTAYRYSSAAIEQIAQHYSIPFIETLDSEYLNSYEYATGKYSAHPTAVQQAQIGTAMIELINDCIMNNYSYFADY